MRRVGTLPDEKTARGVSSLLLVEGIENEVEEASSGEWTVWVYDDEQFEKVSASFDRYVKMAAEGRAEEAEKEAERIRKAAEKAQKDYQRKVERANRKLASMSGAPVTGWLIGICVGVFVLSFLDLVPVWKMLRIANNPYQLAEVRRGEVWRLLTPVFLHGGLMHIFFNMYWLKDLGTAIEKVYGKTCLIGMVLVFGIGSNLLQFYASREQLLGGILGANPLYAHQFGGMSGVVYGLLAFLWINAKFNPWTPLHPNPSIVRFMLIWFFICFLPFMPIANGAHTGGLLLGAGWGYIAARIGRKRS